MVRRNTGHRTMRQLFSSLHSSLLSAAAIAARSHKVRSGTAGAQATRCDRRSAAHGRAGHPSGSRTVTLEQRRPRPLPGRCAGRRPPHRLPGRHRRVDVALRESDAARLGIHPSRARLHRPDRRPRTASARRAPVRLDRVEVDGITVRDVAGAGACPTRRSAGQPARHVVPVAGEVDATTAAGWCWNSRRSAMGRFGHSRFALSLRQHPEIRCSPSPNPSLTPNTYAYESEPLVKPTGFREYDARWLLGKEINLMGVQALGMGLGTLIREMGVKPEIVTGHDFRGYSASVKTSLISGLLAAGCKVHDIGLAMTPMAYFAQFELDVPCVAMVTASHNDNGWTGVKMGANRPLTFGPDEMTRLKEIVLGAAFKLRGRRLVSFRREFPGALHRRPDQAAEAQAQAQGGLRLRQRHGGRVRAAGAGGDRLRGGAARLRARSHVPEIQSQSRRHGDAARHARRGAAHQGRRGAGLRRRRRPLRRGRRPRRGDFRRQGRRDAGARHVGAASELDLRGRREIDRPLRHRSGAAARTASRPTTGRPATPT